MGASVTRLATLTIDAEHISPSRSIAALARAAGRTLVCVTGRAYADLVDELGSDEAAARHLARVATNTGRPICVNFETGAETSTTVFVAPTGWSEDCLRGWAAGRHQELEAAFGPASVVRMEDA